MSTASKGDREPKNLVPQKHRKIEIKYTPAGKSISMQCLSDLSYFLCRIYEVDETSFCFLIASGL